MREYVVYLLQFEDGSYYTGMTNSIERRMVEHYEGVNVHSYVRRKGIFRVAHMESFREVTDAIRREKQIQAWSRKKKDALVAGDDDVLRSLAKKEFK